MKSHKSFEVVVLLHIKKNHKGLLRICFKETPEIKDSKGMREEEKKSPPLIPK